MFIRYNEAIDFWEYDTSPGQTGAGPWLPLPIDINKLTGPGGLPANIAYTDKTNIFVANQTVNGAFSLNVSPIIYWRKSTPNAKWHEFANESVFQIYPVNDAESASLNSGFQLDRAGNISFAGQINGGVVPDARLTTNVALRNVNNNFIANQTLPDYSTISGTNSVLQFNSTGSPPGGQFFRFVNYGQNYLIFESLGDGGIGLNSQPLSLHKDGHVGIGNYISCNHILFPLSQVSSSNANALDDYEEGLWTPSMSSTDGGVATSYSVRVGFYTKIGNVVTIYYDIGASSANWAAGNPYISGLPYTSSSAGSAFAMGSIDYWTGMNGNFITLHPQLNPGSAHFLINFKAGGSSGIDGTLLVSNITPSNRFIGQLTYRTET